MSTRVAYLDCVAGVAGDMVLAALLDAGAPQDRLHATVEALQLAEVKVEVDRVRRHGIDAAHVRIVGAEPATPFAVAELRERLLAARNALGEVVQPAITAFERLVGAEARVHGVAPEDVVFHELGGADTIVDLCGAFVLLDALGIERVVCSPLPFARGLARGEHGRMPTPGPAVLELLVGAPFVGVEAEAELVTPTGAAIVATASSSFGELPPMRIEAVGHGAGTTDLASRPNVVRVILGAPEDAHASSPGLGDVVLLEANLDDLSPELVPDALAACVAAGALDVWTAPAQMKKGRPGMIVSALARPEAERAVAVSLMEHTSTLGVRVSRLQRYELEREIREVRVEGHAVRVKLGHLDGRVVNVAPEHDDCAAVAAVVGKPVKTVWTAALAAAAELTSETAGP